VFCWSTQSQGNENDGGAANAAVGVMMACAAITETFLVLQVFIVFDLWFDT